MLPHLHNNIASLMLYTRCNRLIKGFLDDKAFSVPSADCRLGEVSDKGFKSATVGFFPAAGGDAGRKGSTKKQSQGPDLLVSGSR